mmetsp:Transcript_34584/g.68084  ORF Transcript_34584/g.68084 Transcript_34584/m.68084 type:complete len:285 (-) Transcript_34584:505-1359(-)
MLVLTRSSSPIISFLTLHLNTHSVKFAASNSVSKNSVSYPSPKHRVLTWSAEMSAPPSFSRTRAVSSNMDAQVVEVSSMSVRLKMNRRTVSGRVWLHLSQCQKPSVVWVALGRLLQGSSGLEHAVYHGPPSLSFLMKLIVARNVSQSGFSPCPSPSPLMDPMVRRSPNGTGPPPPMPPRDMDVAVAEEPPDSHQRRRASARGTRGFLVRKPPLRLRPPKSETRAALTATRGLPAKSCSALFAFSPHTVSRTSAPESSTTVISHLNSSFPFFFEMTVLTGAMVRT